MARSYLMQIENLTFLDAKFRIEVFSLNKVAQEEFIKIDLSGVTQRRT